MLKEKRKHRSDDPNGKLHVRYSEGENVMEDIEGLKKGRKKTDLQGGSGTFNSFFSNLKNVSNTKTVKANSKAANQRSFPHWM